MNTKVFLFLLWPITANAQGFAGLGTDVDGFRLRSAQHNLIFRSIMVPTMIIGLNGGI